VTSRLAALVGILLAVAGCLTAPEVLAGRGWVLASVAGREPVADGSLVFGADGGVAVETGCNRGSGAYEVRANRLLFSGLGLTKMACAPDVAEQEAQVMAVVRDGATYRIETGSGDLVLVAGDGTELRFAAR